MICCLSDADMCQRLVLSDLPCMDHLAFVYTVPVIACVQILMTICGLMMTLLMQFVLKMLCVAKLQQQTNLARVAHYLATTTSASHTAGVQHSATLPRKLRHHDKLDRKSKTCKIIWKHWLVLQSKLSPEQLQQHHQTS